MGSPCSFTRRQALKMGYFYWLSVKNSNHFHTEICLGCLKDTKFYLQSKTSFIHISSHIASFKPFLIAWLWEYCTFSDSSKVSLRSSSWPTPCLGQNTPSTETFSKKSCSTIKLFFFFKCSLFDCSEQIPEKKVGGHRDRFKRKRAFISLLSLLWGKSLTFCTCTRPVCAR